MSKPRGKKQTSKVIDLKKSNVLSIRLNPADPNELLALENIKAGLGKGFKLNAIIVDAVNTRNGATPELFAVKQLEGAGLGRAIETMFNAFGAALLAKIKSGDIRLDETETEPGKSQLSAFSQTFGRGVMQRQKQTSQDDDLRYEPLED